MNEPHDFHHLYHATREHRWACPITRTALYAMNVSLNDHQITLEEATKMLRYAESKLNAATTWVSISKFELVTAGGIDYDRRKARVELPAVVAEKPKRASKKVLVGQTGLDF